MGGGMGGSFGNTKGSTLDNISNILAAASLIPGVDTFTDIAYIPIDLLRRDYASAAFDATGILPFIGEIGDSAKLAKTVDKVIDTTKKADKAIDFSKVSKKIHTGRQGKHILGHNNYQKGKSILNISTDSAQKLINKYSGKGKKIGTNREVVDFGKTIGKYVDPKSGKAYETTIGTIHYSKYGSHIVPEKPKGWKK